MTDNNPNGESENSAKNSGANQKSMSIEPNVTEWNEQSRTNTSAVYTEDDGDHAELFGWAVRFRKSNGTWSSYYVAPPRTKLNENCLSVAASGATDIEDLLPDVAAVLKREGYESA